MEPTFFIETPTQMEFIPVLRSKQSVSKTKYINDVKIKCFTCGVDESIQWRKVENIWYCNQHGLQASRKAPKKTKAVPLTSGRKRKPLSKEKVVPLFNLRKPLSKVRVKKDPPKTPPIVVEETHFYLEDLLLSYLQNLENYRRLRERDIKETNIRLEAAEAAMARLSNNTQYLNERLEDLDDELFWDRLKPLIDPCELG
jgi:hypothetical protein